MAPLRDPPSSDTVKPEPDLDRGRRRSRSDDKDVEGLDLDDADDGDAGGDNVHSSNSEGPARKRRRSRKGLDKKFECPEKGCGKSYSRAEHLYVVASGAHRGVSDANTLKLPPSAKPQPKASLQMRYR